MKLFVSLFIFVFLILLKQLGTNERHLLVVRCQANAQSRVESIVSETFKKDARLSMKNATPNSVEYVYALVEWDKKSKNKANIVESLLKVEGVLNVNLVEQTDDIGR